MRTDQLIEMLSTNLEPAPRERIDRILISTVVVGAVTAVAVMLATVAPRPDLGTTASLGYVALKVLFALGVVFPAVAYLLRSMHPGQKARRGFAVVSLPFLVIGAAAVIALLIGPAPAWVPAIFGREWLFCLVCIPSFALLPFAGLIWALRKGAPTNLTHTGAMAGLVAGALGAAAYALHCSDDSLPFIAVWYGGSIMLAAVLGAVLGPRLLRW